MLWGLPPNFLMSFKGAPLQKHNDTSYFLFIQTKDLQDKVVQNGCCKNDS